MNHILVTGTGRCGTGYLAKVLTSVGITCTHEGLFQPRPWAETLQLVWARLEHPEWGWMAESSWLAAPFLAEPELANMTIVHLVRHPKAVMDSQLWLMLYTHPSYGPYYQWARQYLPELDSWASPENKAAVWVLGLNEMIAPHADYIHRVEDNITFLLDALGIDYQDRALFSDKAYNARPGYGPADVQLDDLAPTLAERLLRMSACYGYDWHDQEPRWRWGTLFDDIKVKVTDTAAALGGSWQIRDTEGQPLAYDPGLVKFFSDQVKPGSLIVDVGASTGSFALLPILHDCRVAAFEPNPLAVRALRANVRLNGLQDRVDVHEVALSDRNGHATLQIPELGAWAAVACLLPGKPRRTEIGWRKQSVQVAKMDDYHLAPDLLKVDVEGAELIILTGAEQTITRHKPGILVEYTSLNTEQFGYKRERIMDWLKAHGYNHFQQVGIEDLWATV